MLEKEEKPDMPEKIVTSSVSDRLEPNELVLIFEGRLDTASTAALWTKSLNLLKKNPSSRLRIDASRVGYLDGAGIGLIIELGRRQHQAGGKIEIDGLKEEFHRVLELFNPADFENWERKKTKRYPVTEELGRSVFKIWRDLGEQIAFVGELSYELVSALLHPGRVRWKDTFRVAETAGINALPIVLLISFLVGLIMSFQAAIPMQMFGAAIYVANLIALSMVRELGPLMTAIVLAGRSASAFAAEIGTMRVNEEIDAMTTMGLNPVRFLVVPRVIAAVAMTPILTIFADIIGIVGGAVVLLAMGFPLITYFNQVLSAVDYGDYVGGLLKSFVFGVLIAGIGCLRGLQTGQGASAVGDSTTRAVVSGIVLIVATDGVFSVIYYYLGV